MIIINLSYILNIVVILFLIRVLAVAFIATNIICVQKYKFMIFTTQLTVLRFGKLIYLIRLEQP